MATSPNSGNAAPSEFGLPHVAEGDPIKASDINSLSAAIEKIAIGFGEDGKIRVIKEYLDGRVSRLQEAGELPLDEGKEPFPWPNNPESQVP